MHQISIGSGCVIDTDEIQYSETSDLGDDGVRVLVMFKNGQDAILRGDAKAVFDEWAAGLRATPAPKQGALCATCEYWAREGECMFEGGERVYPVCYEATLEPSEAESSTSEESQLCDSCLRSEDGEHCARAYDEAFPGCHKPRQQ